MLCGMGETILQLTENAWEIHYTHAVGIEPETLSLASVSGQHVCEGNSGEPESIRRIDLETMPQR